LRVISFQAYEGTIFLREELQALSQMFELKISNTCSVEGCKSAFHHTLLHYSSKSECKAKLLQEKETSSTDDSQHIKAVWCACSVVNHSRQPDSEVFLCVLPVIISYVIISYGGKDVSTNAFLDQGSTFTFCTGDLIECLQIGSSRSNISLQTINSKTSDCASIVCELQ